MMKNMLIAVIAALLLSAACAAEIPLVKDGVAMCRIVVAKDASHAEKFGAKELSAYLERATGAKVGIVERTENDEAYRITIAVKSNPLDEDGFVIETDKKGTTITGSNPRGALYGCYRLLKDRVGVRWFMPGEDGEYVPSKKTVTVVEGRKTFKPALRCRSVSSTWDSALLWEVRNGFIPNGMTVWYKDKKTGGLSERGRRCEEMGVAPSGIGGHVMSALMFGKGWGTTRAERLATATKCFEKHPEWFPMIKGERHLGNVSNESSPNPCLSNPALLDHMASNLIEAVKGPYGAVGYCTLGNNDTTKWCECEKCRALDAPEAKGTQGERADRYWWVVNELARRVWKVLPDAHLGGWAYQDFWFPPRRVKPDKRLRVVVSFNCQCWRHAVNDPDCTVNRAFRAVYSAWKTLDMPIVMNRDEIACSGAPGSDYLPSERVLRDSFRAYPELGCAGSSLFIAAPSDTPEFCAWERNDWPFYGKNLRWRAMWQTLYLAGELMWNPDADFDALYEECNALYYGKAWDGGFRDFKRLQTKLFETTPGCIGLGMDQTMVGRCLDVIGSEEKLGALMEKAVAAARAEPDPKFLKRILTDKEIFEKTWLDSAKRRRAELGALDIFRADGDIELDGEAREHDWKVANVRPFFGKNRANVRACWKERELRFFVEWEQGPMTLSFELPDGSDKVERVSVSASGKVSSTVPDVCANVHGNKAEVVIPLASTGWRCLEGGNWKVKIGDPDSPHGFVQMRMIPARQGVFKVEKTYRYWSNATFDEGFPTSNIAKAQQWVHWTNEIGVADVPRPWGGPQAWGATKSHEPGGTDRYVTILPEKDCVFSQGYVAPVSGKMRLTFRARGKGSVRVWSACYHTEPVTKLMSETAKGETFKVTDTWQTYSADFTKTGAPDESVMVRFFAADAPVDIDDAYFNPL